MSIAYPPDTVPYSELVKEQKAHAQTKQALAQVNQLLAQEREAHKQTRQQLGQERGAKQQRRQFMKTKFKPAEKLMIEETQRQIDSPQSHKDAEGYTRLCFETAAINMGMSSKTPKRSLEAVIEQAPTLPLETKEVDEPSPDGKGTIPRLYVKANSNLLAAATTTSLEQKRVQGGNQYRCLNPACNSLNVMVERRLVCLDCGHISNLEPTYPNGKLKSGKRAQPSKTNLVLTQSPETPEVTPENFLTSDGQPVGVGYITSDPPIADSLSTTPTEPNEFEEQNDIADAAALLLAVAGTADTHIYMTKTDEKKYKTRDAALTLADMVDHLRGGRARGAMLVYPDGQTRAYCFDTDNAEGWELLQEAAGILVSAGYNVILAPSPAGRGGHIWIIFDALVYAAAVRHHLLALAPRLAEICEYWPYSAANNQHVRLPGAKYVRYGEFVEKSVNAWCRLFCVSTGETANDGVRAARLLLASLTPAQIVPDLPVIIDSEAPTTSDQGEEHTALIVVEQDAPTGLEIAQQEEEAPTSCKVEEPEAPTIQPVGAATPQVDQGVRLPEVDQIWIDRYGPVEKTTCYFAVMPNYAAEEYNRDHSLDEIHPRERNGMALSPNGNERTASTGYRMTAQGERYTDHSQLGRRADGTRDTGDCLELTAKVEQKSKPALFRMTTGQIIKKATSELEAAARSGQPIPAWLEFPTCIITPAGRRRYAELLAQSYQPDAIPADHPQAEELTPASVPQDTGQGEVIEELPPPDVNDASKLQEPSKAEFSAAHRIMKECELCNIALVYPEGQLGATITPPDEFPIDRYLALIALEEQHRPALQWVQKIQQEQPPADVLQDVHQQQTPAPLCNEEGQAPEEPATHKIGTCAVCGSTRWYPHPEVEYFCAKCHEPIAYTRSKKNQTTGF